MVSMLLIPVACIPTLNTLPASPNQPGSMIVFGGYDLDLVRRSKGNQTGKGRGGTSASSSTVDSVRASNNSALSSQTGAERGSNEVGRGEGVQQRRRPRLRGRETTKQRTAETRRKALLAGGYHGIEDAGTVDQDTVLAVDDVDSRRTWVGGNRGKTRAKEGENVRGLFPRLRRGIGLARRRDTLEEGSESRKVGQRHGTIEEEEEAEDGEEDEEMGTAQRKGKGRRQGPGKQEEEHSDNVDEHHDDDEPVIIWTPVVEYRGSLSYWTVPLTGWRTETSTAVVDHGRGVAL